MAIAGLIVGIIAVVLTVYFALKPKAPSKLQEDVDKIKTDLHQIALYLDGLPETKDRNKKTLFEKGISLMAQYKYEEAIESFRECLNLESDGSEKVALLILIGNSFYAWNKWDQALGSWKEALETAQQIKNELGESAALGNLGLVYQDKGEWDKAIEFYNKGLKIKEKIGDAHGMAQTFNLFGLNSPPLAAKNLGMKIPSANMSKNKVYPRNIRYYTSQPKWISFRDPWIPRCLRRGSSLIWVGFIN